MPAGKSVSALGRGFGFAYSFSVFSILKGGAPLSTGPWQIVETIVPASTFQIFECVRFLANNDVELVQIRSVSDPYD